MKKYFLSVGISVLLFMTGVLQGCSKEISEEIPTNTVKFAVKVAEMSEDNDTKAVFNSDDFLSLVFVDGDLIKVNGAQFTLHYGANGWYAEGNAAGMTNGTHDTLLGDEFYCFYGQNPASSNPIGQQTYSSVKFVGSGTSDDIHPSYQLYHSGIVLAGKTTDSTIVFYPTFAVIRLHRNSPAGITVNQALVGFSENVAVYQASVTPTTGTPTLSSASYLTAVSKSSYYDEDFEEYVENYNGDFLVANTDDITFPENGANSYHVIVPLASESINDVTLYLRYKMTNNSTGKTVIKYGKKTGFSMQRGKVYTINVN